MKVLILIPVRYQSSRFPGKPLANLANRPLFSWAFKECLGRFSETYLITDSDEIAAKARDYSPNCLIVKDELTSGTERVALAYKRHFANKNFDYIINVQGDEPLLKAETLVDLVEFHGQNKQFGLTTIVTPGANEKEFKSPDVVKAVYDKQSGSCHYFSRSPVPYPKNDCEWFKHVGVYCFRPEVLTSVFSNPQTHPLARIEDLEQLNVIAKGVEIGAIVSERKMIGVDKPEDIDKVLQYWESHEQ